MSSEALSGAELALALVGPLVILVMAHLLQLRISKRIIVTLFRTVIQLLLAGYVLLGFIFSMQSPVYVLGYLLLMVVISSFEVTSRQNRTYKGYVRDSFVSVLIGGGDVGLYGSSLVFHTTPWWQPHIMVPTAGMLIGNSISGPALGVDKLFSEVCDRSYEIEFRLALGATKYEAILPTIRAAMLVALTPNMNQMAVVGIISIPGMMTGQLLAGASPLVAAEYQLVILWLIFATVGLSTFSGLFLALRNAVFDDEHRLTLSKISKKEKSSLEAVLTDSVTALSFYICKCCLPSNSTPAQSCELTPFIDATEKNYGTEMFGMSNAGGVVRITFENINENFSKNDSFGCSDYPFFEVSDFNVEFLGKSSPFFCDNISFNMQKGEILALEGKSGVGKTMFLRSLALFNRPRSGKMRIGGNFQCESIEPLLFCAGADTVFVPLWRRRCIYVPQAIPPLNGTPISLIEEALVYRSRSMLRDLSEINDMCNLLEKMLLLGDGKLRIDWAKLSGGERQRAAIACALILLDIDNSGSTHSLGDDLENNNNRKKCAAVLFLDEPTAACDPVTTEAVESALRRSGATIVLTTHDQRQSARIADRRMIFSRCMS